MAQPKLENSQVANFLFIICGNNGGNTNTGTLNGEINIGGKSDGYMLFQSRIGFFAQISRTDISECRARDGGGRQNTLSHAHLFSVSRTLTITRTCVWLKGLTAQVWDVLHLCAPWKSPTHNMCHRPLLDVPDPFPSFCSTPPPSMTGIRRFSCDTPRGGLQFGHLVESTPFTGYEPKTCIDVSSEHTPINYSSRRTSFKPTTTTSPPQSQPPKPRIWKKWTVDFTTDVAGTRSKL